MSQTVQYFYRLSALLLIKVFFILSVILWAGIGLGPDEAQYWTWSQHLDWGYYSKPPGIAWQIWLGTQLAGQTELGVRLMTLFWGMGQAWLVYLLALQCRLKPRTAFWSGILMAFSPLGMAGSFFAITDGGALFFWSAACLVMVTALNNAKAPSPYAVGLCLSAGALFKWPVYIFGIFYFCCWRRWYPHQSLKVIVGGAALSLVSLLPSVWWNYHHDWVTFRHVSATLQGGHGSSGGNFFEFIGSQMLLIFPILFILLIISYVLLLKERKIAGLSPQLTFCGSVTFACLLMAILLSFFQKIQGNWMAFAYPTAFVWLAWFYLEKNDWGIKWLQTNLIASVCLIAAVLMLPSLYGSKRWRPAFLSYRINPFKHNMGWMTLADTLDKVGYDPLNSFLLSDKYQTTSILNFYGASQKKAYFLNLHQSRQNQFSYWPSFQEECIGESGYFVWAENQPYLEREWEAKWAFYQTELEKYFGQVEFLGFWPLLYEGSKTAKAVFIFKCSFCKNNALPQTFLY
ncbi:MAG: glycosyltransferase family 39 protein [Candidatus Protochlamydia sp.]|nr:glycosyltransferase family 39 protein [Candidatus Protochlamydia sp.]